MWPVREYPLLTPYTSLLCWYADSRGMLLCMKWSRNGPIPRWPATAELAFIDTIVGISPHLDSRDSSENARQ